MGWEFPLGSLNGRIRKLEEVLSKIKDTSFDYFLSFIRHEGVILSERGGEVSERPLCRTFARRRALGHEVSSQVDLAALPSAEARRAGGVSGLLVG